MIKAVLFDFDGTLCNSEEGIFYTARRVMEELGEESNKSDEEMRGFVGPMLPECFRLVFNLREDKIDEAVERYRAIYKERGCKMLYLYPGMKEALLRLKKNGLKLAVATNKGQAIIEECISYLGLENVFDRVEGTDKDKKRNKVETIGYTLSSLAVSPDEAIMVGDTRNDEEGALKNGVKFIKALWGFGFKGEKSGLSPEDAEKMANIILKENLMIERISTDKAPKAIGPYSQAVKVNGFVFASGQIPIIPETGEIREGSASEQAEQCFLNIKEVLKAAGTDITKVVKATVFLKDMNDFVPVNAVYEKAFQNAPVLPARSAVQVGKLPKDVKVEIEVIALA